MSGTSPNSLPLARVAICFLCLLFSAISGLSLAAEPLPSNVLELVNESGGIAEARFAFGCTLSETQFQKLDAALKPHGLQPARVRPFATAAGLRIAALWLPSTVPCEVSLHHSREALIEEETQRKSRGFYLGDLCGYPGAEPMQPLRHTAVWRKTDDDKTGQTVFATEVPASQVTAVINKLTADKRAPLTLQAYRGSQGELLFAFVCGPSDVAWNYRWDLVVNFEHTLEERREDSVQTDIGVFFRTPFALREANTATLEYWQAELKKDPGNDFAACESGGLACSLSRWEEAERDLSVCLSKQADHAPALANRFIARTALKKSEEADADWKAYLATKPAPEQLAYYRLISQTLRGEFPAAMEELKAEVKRAEEKGEGEPILKFRYQAILALCLAAEYDRRATGRLRDEAIHEIVSLMEKVPLKRLENVGIFGWVADHPRIAEQLERLQLDRRYSGAWQRSQKCESRLVKGLSIAEHTATCRSLAAAGWRPHSIAASELIAGRPVVATVWERDLPEPAHASVTRFADAVGLANKGQMRAAIEILQVVVQQRSESLGNDHPLTLTARTQLAKVYMNRGNLAEAGRLLEGSATQLGQRQGPRMDEWFRTYDAYLMALADYTRDAGEWQKAFDILRELSLLRATYLDLTDLRQSAVSGQLAEMSRVMQLPEADRTAVHEALRLARQAQAFEPFAALPRLEQAVSALRRHLGDESPSTYRTRLRQLRLLIVLDRLHDAHTLADELNAIEHPHLKLDHIDAQFGYANVFERQGKPEQTLAWLSHAEFWKKQAAAGDSQEHFQLLDRIATLQRKELETVWTEETLAAKVKMAQELLENRKTRHGEQSPEFLEAAWISDEYQQLASLPSEQRERWQKLQSAPTSEADSATCHRAWESELEACLAATKPLTWLDTQVRRQMLATVDPQKVGPFELDQRRRIKDRVEAKLGADHATRQRRSRELIAALQRYARQAAEELKPGTAVEARTEVVRLFSAMRPPDQADVVREQSWLEDDQRLETCDAAGLQQYAAACQELIQAEKLNDTDTKAALQRASRAAAVLSTLIGDEHYLTRRARRVMSVSYFRQNEPGRADQLLRFDLEVLQRRFGANNATAANEFLSLGRVESSANEHDRAITRFRRAWKILRETSGPDDVETREAAETLEASLAAIIQRRFAAYQFAAALPVCRERTEVLAELHGVYDWRTLEAGEAGRLCEQLGKLDAAQLSAAVSALRLIDVDMQDQIAAGKIDEALATVQRARNSLASLLTPSSLPVARSLHWEGALLTRLARLEEAQAVLKTAGDTFRQVIEDDSKEELEVRGMQAAAAYARGKHDEARQLQVAAISLARRMVGTKDSIYTQHASQLITWFEEQARGAEKSGDIAAAKRAQAEALILAESVFEAADVRLYRIRSGRDYYAKLETFSDNERAQAKQIVEFNKQAAAAEARRDLDGQIAALEQVEKLTSELYGEESPAHASALHHLGSAQTTAARYAPAEATIARAISIRRKVSGESSIELAYLLRARATVLFRTNRYDESLQQLEESRGVAARAVGAEHVEYAHHLNDLGLTLQRLRRWQPAEENIQQALVIYRSLGAKSAHEAQTLTNLGHLLAARQLNAQAEEKYRASLEMWNSLPAESRLDSIWALQGLANTAAARNRHDEAALLHTQSWELCRQHLGKQHLSSFDAAGNLASTLKILGAKEKLQALIAEVDEANPDTSPAALLVPGNHLAWFHLQAGNTDRAIALYRATWRARREAYGADHALTTQVLNNFAVALERRAQAREAQDDFAGAAPDYRELQRIITEFQGASSRPAVSFRISAEDLETIIKLAPPERAEYLAARKQLQDAVKLAQQFKHAAAVELLEAAAGRFENLGLGESSDALNVYARWGTSYGQLGRNDDALRCYRIAAERRAKRYGDKHPAYAHALVALARQRSWMDGAVAAEADLEQARAIYRDHKMQSTNEYFMLVHLQAQICLEQEDYSRAVALCREALEGHQRVNGERHVQTLRVLLLRAEIERRSGQMTLAVATGRAAIDLAESLDPPKPQDVIEAHSELARTYQAAEQLETAESLLAEAARCSEEITGAPSIDSRNLRHQQIELLTTIQNRHFDRENFAAAAKLGERIVPLAEAIYAANDGRLGNARQARLLNERLRDASADDVRAFFSARNQASEVQRLEDRGKLAEALQKCRDVLAVYRRILTNEHRHTALQLRVQGRLLRKLDQPLEAEACLRESVEMYLRVLGPRHVDTQQAMITRASFLESQGKLTEAVADRRATAAASAAVWGGNSPQATEANMRLLSNLGSQLSEGPAKELSAEQLAKLTAKILNDVQPVWTEKHSSYRLLSVFAQDRQQRAGLTRDQRARWDALSELAAEVTANAGNDKFTKQAAQLEAALPEATELMGADSLALVDLLIGTGQGKVAAKDWKAAAKLSERTLTIRINRLGDGHPVVLMNRTTIARMLASAGDKTAAEKHYEQVLAALRAGGYAGTTDFLTNHEELCQLLDDQRQKLVEQRQVEPAVEVQRRVWELRQRDLGGSDWRTRDARREIDRLQQWAALKPQDAADYLHALELEQQAHATREQNLRKSLALLRESAEIERRIFGAVAPVAERYQELAIWGNDLTDFEQAAADLRTALEIGAEAWGRNHPSYVRSLSSLAAVSQSSPQEQVAIQTQVVATLRKLKGIKDHLLPTAVSQLGLAQLTAGQADSARRSLYEALDLFRKADDQSLEYSICLGYVAQYHIQHNELELARGISEESLAIARKFASQRPTRFLDMLDAHRQLLDFLDKAPESLAAANEYLAVAERHDPDHLRLAIARYRCATAELACAHPAVAVTHLRKCFEHFTESARTAARSSEREQVERTAAVQNALELWLTLAVDQKLPVDEAYLPVLQWKGSAFLEQRLKRQLRARPELLPVLDELVRVNSKIAALAVMEAEEARRLQHQTELSQLRARRTTLDQELNRLSSAHERTVKEERLSIADVSSGLGPDEVFIDICQYFDARPGGEMTNGGARIVVFVLKSGSPARWLAFDRQQTAALSEHVDKWRLTLGGDDSGRQAGAALKRDFWDKLEIADAKTVLSSPSGVLASIPFGALPGSKEDRYLIEEIMCACIPTPRLLKEWTSKAPELPAEIELLALGAVAYDGTSGAPAPANADLARHAIRAGDAKPFTAIDGSRKESLAIEELFRQTYADRLSVTPLYGGDASETRFRDVAPRAAYMHLATHGFQSFQRANPSSTFTSRDSRPPQTHVGLLCGVALAGANSPKTPRGELVDDGLMTGLEVADLDLSHCRLVVLSACETGVGSANLSEGSLSLQRAFAVAGAQTTISSLWPVYDEATRALMEEFYSRLLKRPAANRTEILAGLCEAQRELIRSYIPATGEFSRGLKLPKGDQGSLLLPPAYWAGFVVSGRWR